MYYCVACHGSLIDESSNIQICTNCKRRYPSINGIDVFTLPDAMDLQGYILETKETIKQLESEIDCLDESKNSPDYDKQLEKRIENAKKGMMGNIKVLKESYLPIIEFTQNQLFQANDFSSSVVKTNFSFNEMIPYFYQDWFGVPDYEKVKDLIYREITNHCHDKESVAVLGAGACGLIYNVADYFKVSIAVDLSLPTLLTAKKFIEGTPLKFYLKDADWSEVRLTPPASSTHDIRYLTANVMTLPFKDNTLSVVITQYLLDVVSYPEGFIEEIYRILKPDGVWINFSNPFKIQTPSELGRYKLNELPHYFNKLGFDVLNLECQHFTLLNLEKIYPEADCNNQIVHFFTLSKNQQSAQHTGLKPNSRFFNKSDSIWNEVPHIIKGRELTFLTRVSSDIQFQNEQMEIGLMEKYLSVKYELGCLLQIIFQYIDGISNLKELFLNVQKQMPNLSEANFLTLIYFLNIQYYLIDLKD